MSTYASGFEQAFPLEIYKLIIDEVAALPDSDDMTDLSNLLTLALVSRSFCHLSRSQIFSEVSVDVRAESLQGTKRSRKRPLLQLLSQRPTLAMWVKRLLFCDSDSYDRSAARTATLNNTTFKVLFQFSHLSTLSINGNGRDYEGNHDHQYGWGRLLPHYLATSHLTSLSLISIQCLPILHIFSCTSLVHLELRKCGFIGWSATDTPSLDILKRGFKLKTVVEVDAFATVFPLLPYCLDLEEIEIIGAPVGVSFPRFPMPTPAPRVFKNLRKIESRERVDWSSLCYPASKSDLKAFPAVRILILEFLGTHKSSMGELGMANNFQSLECIDIKGNLISQFKALNIYSCIINHQRSMKEIAIRWRLDSFNQDELEDVIISTICDSLEAIQGQNILEAVTLDIHLSVADGKIIDLPHSQWRRLDALLMEDRASRYPRLKEVNIEVGIRVHGWGRRNNAYLSYNLEDFDDFLDEPLSRIRSAASDEVQNATFRSTYDVYSESSLY